VYRLILNRGPDPYIQEGHVPLHFSRVGGTEGHVVGVTENAER